MSARTLSEQDAAFLLDLDNTRLQQLSASGMVKTSHAGGRNRRYVITDLLVFQLGRALIGVGVDPEKASLYAEAVLGTRAPLNDKALIDWVENEAQELFCALDDGQLSRIFLRNKEDGKEMDVGAIKPVLFPTSRCEINVFRVIRPVVIRARKLVVGAS
jgi:hypothetical protein